MVRLVIDPVVCVGIGVCEERAHHLVEIGDDQIARPRGRGLVVRAEAETLRRACPSGAVDIDDGRHGTAR